MISIGFLFLATLPNYSFTGYESGTQIIQSQALHEIGIIGATQHIGYSDTGLDSGENNETLHRDFWGKIYSTYSNVEDGWRDTHGHGTAIAGLLAGGGTLLEEKIKASSFGAKLIVQSLIQEGKFKVPLEFGEKVLSPAYRDGARIHSNSWTAKKKRNQYSPYTEAIDRFVWENQEMVIIFPAGNLGEDLNQDGIIDEGSILVPGNCKNCLTVGASENFILEGGIQMPWGLLGSATDRWPMNPIASDYPSDHTEGIAALSSRGPTSDGRIKPDLVAPGTNLLTTKSRFSEDGMWGIFNEHYVWVGGTSVSTAVVASGVALVREYLITKRAIPFPSAALLKALILNNAVDLYPGQFGDVEKKEITQKRPNVHEGWGRLDLRNILEREDRKIILFDEKEGLSSAEEKEIALNVVDSEEPFSITLAYTDFPGALAASRALVNDLDLEVRDSLSRLYYPNRKEEKDDLNNVETVDVFHPPLGPLHIKIKGVNIPEGKNGKQPYALVISGGVREKE